MPVYLQGSATYVGLLRQSLSAGKEPEGTTLGLRRKAHVWDGRRGRYLGYGRLAKGGRLPDGPALEPGRWYALALHWDLDKHCCQVLVDGRPAGLLPALSKTSPGACYLRLRCTAQTKDPAGMLVESVRARVE